MWRLSFIVTISGDMFALKILFDIKQCRYIIIAYQCLVYDDNKNQLYVENKCVFFYSLIIQFNATARGPSWSNHNKKPHFTPTKLLKPDLCLATRVAKPKLFWFLRFLHRTWSLGYIKPIHYFVFYLIMGVAIATEYIWRNINV